MRKDIQKQIEEAIRDRARAKSMEVEAKEINARVKSILLPIMISHDIKKYELEGVGEVAIRVSNGSSINETKLREQLLLQEIDPGDIDQIVTDSSKTWKTEYVNFTEKR